MAGNRSSPPTVPPPTEQPAGRPTSESSLSSAGLAAAGVGIGAELARVGDAVAVVVLAVRARRRGLAAARDRRDELGDLEVAAREDDRGGDGAVRVAVEADRQVGHVGVGRVARVGERVAVGDHADPVAGRGGDVAHERARRGVDGDLDERAAAVVDADLEHRLVVADAGARVAARAAPRRPRSRSLAFMQPGSGRSLRSLGASTWPSPSSSIPFEHWFVEPPPPPPPPGRAPAAEAWRCRRSRPARAPRPSRSSSRPARTACRTRAAAVAAPSARRSPLARPAALERLRQQRARGSCSGAGRAADLQPAHLALDRQRHRRRRRPRRAGARRRRPAGPFFAAPVTAIPAGAFALTFAFFADRRDGDRRPGLRAAPAP